MKRIYIAVIAFMVFAVGCQNPPQQNNVTIENNTTSGFDVNKLAQFVKTSTDPQVLEKAINDPKNQINNLDLDKDGNIPSESVTVASVNITPNGNTNADLSIQGNPSYVGYNNYYHSSFSFTDFLLLSYMLHPHSYYVPMYHYGYYPPYYSHVRTVTTFRPTSSPAMSSRAPSRSSLGSPSGSQRSFGTRNPSNGVRSGGFGNGSSRGTGFGRSSGSGRSFGRGGGFGRRR